MKLLMPILSVIAACAAASPAAAQTATSSKGGEIVCARYSSIVLTKGENAIVDGAGGQSLSLTITGPAGSWIFYDALIKPQDRVNMEQQGVLVHRSDTALAYRRPHNARIYAVVPADERLIDGQPVQVGVMGVNLIGQVLDNPAITGTNADVAVLKRVMPGHIGKCDFRWKSGEGLLRTRG